MISDTENGSTRGIRELSLLFDISSALSETLDLKTVLHPILTMMAKHMGMLRGSLTVLNRKTEEIVIEESYGLSPGEQAKGKYRLGEGITGKVVETGKPVVVPRISDEPLFLDRTGARRDMDRRDIAFICVPIKIGSEVIGALSADRLFNESVSLDEDVRFMTIISSSISQAVRLRQLAQEEMEKLRDENRRLHDELMLQRRPDTIIGNSGAMKEIYALIEKVCDAATTVLILGESGVGKEKVAAAIHFSSKRAGKPFIKVNCAALPETLIESELFGSERGAFTGAVASRKGRFELSDGGTIFLDEIGDLPVSVQTKLLRVIQEKEFERIGGMSTITVNARIITATNRDLESLMRAGRFREDLYYRLNVFPIVVPPLRERKTDVMLLADHFIEKYGTELGKSVARISTPAIDMLMSYHWPGNVRELENCIERAVILSTDGVIHSYHLPPSLQKADNPAEGAKGSLKDMIAVIEKEIIIEELKRSQGNMAKAARALGITERIMGLRVEKYGIDLKRFR
ncbi:MAG: sigma-54-dependent Fis family transcriptional regulator [Spirochaetes bacterium RBG_16_49_21]|nr:MAG: sigma-54-dependent Fis family transcriptional regulator [Spirochaetes bacterium RBG_16_49_21]